jgi:hypothetical protein
MGEGTLFVRCDSCGTVTGPLQLVSVDLPKSPCCPQAVVGRWPSNDLLRLLDVARAQNIDAREGRRVAAVFLASALEGMCKDILTARCGFTDRLPEGVQELRRALQRNLPQPVDAIVVAFLPSGLERNWSHLIRIRNAAAHGQFTVAGTMDLVVLQEFLSGALPAFAALWNAASSRHHPSKRPG